MFIRAVQKFGHKRKKRYLFESYSERKIIIQASNTILQAVISIAISHNFVEQKIKFKKNFLISTFKWQVNVLFHNNYFFPPDHYLK